MPFHSYIVFDGENSIRALSKSDMLRSRKSFLTTAQKNKSVHLEAYGTLGLKAGTRFMLHINAARPEDVQNFLKEQMHTSLGAHLRITYTLMGLVRKSMYNPDRPPKEKPTDAPHKYLVVYPFTKTTEWHLMPYDERKKIMWDHVQVGRKHSDKIAQRLLYAYGIDDHEFIVSYYMDDLEAFQSLVMEMRETESRRYTKNDLPIFTGIHMSLAEALEML